MDEPIDLRDPYPLLARRHVHGTQRHVPHAAAGQVDDALERQVIGRLVQHA